ncbi:MAG: DUF5652 family protein [Patescibacteria group bacterium]
MIQNFGSWFSLGGMGMSGGWFSPFFLIVLVWALYWKGRALWRAARKGEKNWFIALLVINTVGILEILYLYVFNKKPAAPEVPKPDIN